MTTNNKQLYIGIMSGTSLDGVDCVIYDFKNSILIANSFTAYTTELKQQIIGLFTTTLENIANLDIILGEIYTNCVLDLLTKYNIDKNEIIAIGLHGQTIYHHPKEYSWQIGNLALIAKKTAITVIGDFRTNDILAGGQGAPLTPKYHQYLLGGNGIIVNLGGIANITHIKNNKIIGFDSGPANTLMNHYMLRVKNIDYDKKGSFARSGLIIDSLLQKMLQDNYFSQKFPKSTGTEYFNLAWLDSFLIGNETPQDIVRTLAELTAVTISKYLTNGKIYFCGGGVFNLFLMERLHILNPNCEILTTMELGLHPNFIEAVAFAYFAKLNLENKPANIKNVTGAREEVVLGVKYKINCN